MITFQQHTSNPLLALPTQKSGPAIRTTEITTTALRAINRSERRRVMKQSDEIFWMKIRLRILFQMLKNAFSNLRAKILIILFLIDLVLSGIPLEDLQDIVNALIDECKKDLKFLDFLEEMIPLILDLNVPLEELLLAAHEIEKGILQEPAASMQV